MEIHKLSDFRRIIGNLINESSDKKFPKVVSFNRGIEFPKYKITIEEVEEDYFVDAKGQKWAKVKD